MLDAIAPPYADASHQLITGGAFAHIHHILDYAAHQTSPNGPQGIASYPWQWLVDTKPIPYLDVNPSRPSPGLTNIQPPVHFLGMISPPILLAGLMGLILVLVSAVMRWRPSAGVVGPLAVAWFLATFLPFVIGSLLLQRTSYLYYMVIVMPGLYLAGAYLVARLRPPRLITGIWVLTVVAAAFVMYPLSPVRL